MKKGFTLIELLAVIVILAIISLIAVPIVLNIINDSKNSSDEQSVELYIDAVQKAIAKKQLGNSSFNPDNCEIQNNGNLDCNGVIIEVETKGKIPSSGTIKINNNKIIYRNIFYESKYYHKNKQEIKSITDNPKYAELISDADNNNEVSIGDKYTYQVNERNTFYFYVLTEPLEGQVNLIMDRNICEDGTVYYKEENDYCKYRWHYASGYNLYGPDTAMQILYEATKNWTNVKDMFMSYEDEAKNEESEKGYISIKTIEGVISILGKDYSIPTIIGTKDYPLKARLPKLSEVQNAECDVSNVGTCPVWLVENLKYWNVANNKYSINSKNSSETAKGYWTLSSAGNDYKYALIVSYMGEIDGALTNDEDNGIRPVITVPIEYLES